ncbi:hypothetical protein PRIPAC_77589 [Pristionchus pacificus]|uniref:Uncharacterized protein n=1 Tax=Pristionchus pacificus TaxID=54126 RepID=A0A2A6CJK7_PRIPA|nr:hypothetical protein PRIPAC_77589 [Pristionchus pacificus]|eukprot:PDM78201.1 hypothetical protein PRIPAC_30780 [Pristionchus pacificus]
MVLHHFNQILQLPYNFRWERDAVLDFIHRFQVLCPILSLLTDITSYRKLDSRGVLNMLDRSYLFIKAVPAYHCDGFICGDYGFDIPQQGIMTFTDAVGIPNFYFNYLLFSMHQQLLNHMKSRTILLRINDQAKTFSGRYIAISPSYRPELSWLKERNGKLLIFGDVGDALEILLLSPRVSSAQFERRCVYVNSRYVRDTKHKGSVFFSEIVNHVINKDVHIGQDGDFATTRDDCSSHTSTMF